MGKRQDGQGGVGTTTMVGKMLRTVGLLRPLTTTTIGRWREGRLVKVFKDTLGEGVLHHRCQVFGWCVFI